MVTRTSPLLLRALLEVNEAGWYKSLQAKPRGSNVRHLASCGILSTRPHSQPLPPAGPLTPSSRSFINLAVPLVARRMDYSENRTLGYSPEQIYNVVSRVDQYQHFVPWCKKSRVLQSCNGELQAQLEIGFPPIIERYTSKVTMVANHQVRAVCTDASLFNHLETVWRFSPESPEQPCACKVQFFVSFEFKSLLHSQLATVFFDDVVKQMVNAFEKQARKLYGPQMGLRT